MAFHAFPAQLPGGFVGVDVFFVVSGYLISEIILTNLERGTFSFLEFYARRIRRIFPALCLVLAATLALGWTILFADELKQLGKHAAAGAGFVSNLVLWSEAGYFDDAAAAKPLLHLWSLGVEEQFYLFWPLVLWLALRSGRGLPALATLIAAVSFTWCLFQAGEHPAAAFFNPLTRLWELALGGLLAARAASQAPGSPDLRSWTGFLMVAMGVVLITPETPFPGAWTLLPAVGTWLVVSAGREAWLNRRVLSNPALVGIGLVSYPLYLWHWPLLSFARIAEGAEAPASVRLAIVLVSAGLAALTYVLVERPVRSGAASRAAVAGLCAAMIAAGVAGYACYRLEGVPAREAARLQSLNRFDRPYQKSCRDLTGQESRDDWCNPGNRPGSAPEIVMIGDSYANSYAPMLASLLDGASPNLAFVQFGRQQCPMLSDYGPPYCREIARKALAYIASSPSVRTVVLAANWPIYLPGQHPGWRERAPDDGDFDAAFERTVSGLQRQGKRVAVFLAPPGGSNPRACAIRRIRLTSEDHCGLRLDVARRLEGDYRKSFLPRLARRSIPFFDPFPFLCDAATCRITDGSRVLSADGYHLSVFGGEFLARNAGSELLRILKMDPL